MNFNAKFLLDYETLFMNHHLLSDFHDCLIMIPYSSFTLFNQMVTDIINSKDFSPEEKNDVKEIFKPFMDIVYAQPTIFDEITKEGKKMSSAISISLVNDTYLCFTNSFEYSTDIIPAELHNNIDQFNYDVIAASKLFDCPILTTNKELVKIISENNILVEYVTPDLE